MFRKSFLIRDLLDQTCHQCRPPEPPLWTPAPLHLYGLYCAAVGQHLVDSSEVRPTNRKARRNRTVFTENQLIGLELRFDTQKYLSTPDRAELARDLGLTQLQVKTWYQNRRMKWKKQVMQSGCQVPPTKPKGRPKKNSIPSLAEALEAQAMV